METKEEVQGIYNELAEEMTNYDTKKFIEGIESLVQSARTALGVAEDFLVANKSTLTQIINESKPILQSYVKDIGTAVANLTENVTKNDKLVALTEILTENINNLSILEKLRLRLVKSRFNDAIKSFSAAFESQRRKSTSTQE